MPLWGKTGSSRSQHELPLSAERTCPPAPISNLSRALADRNWLDWTAGFTEECDCSVGAVRTHASVHVERRIFLEDVGGRHQHVLRHRVRHQRLSGQQTQGERKYLVAVAVHVIGDRAEHDAAAVVRIDLLLFAGAAMDVPVETLADNNAIALPPVHFDRFF